MKQLNSILVLLAAMFILGCTPPERIDNSGNNSDNIENKDDDNKDDNNDDDKGGKDDNNDDDDKGGGGEQNPLKPTTKPPYEIGDYYNENGKEGIVVDTEDDGYIGKIVSLYPSTNALQWTSDATEQNRLYGLYEPENASDGSINFERIKQIEGWRDKFPAFRWCADYGDGWYLPAYQELEQFIIDPTVREAVNRGLTENGGAPLSDVSYWSSTEDGSRAYEGICLAKYVNTKTMTTASNLKKFKFYVCAVAAFDKNPDTDNPNDPTDDPTIDWDNIVCESSEIWYMTNGNTPISLDENGDYGAKIVRHYFTKGIGVIQFDGQVTNIPEWTFRTNLDESPVTKVKLPNGLKTLQSFALAGCSNLIEVVLPDSITEIGSGCFSGCKSLPSIKIPQGVTVFEPDLFRDCTSLKSVDVHDNITEIGGSCFYGCTSLTSFKIPPKVTTIRVFTFNGCSSLATVEIHAGVKVIELHAFNYCTNMQRLHIPSTVDTLSEEIAVGCGGELIVDCDIICKQNEFGGYGDGYDDVSWSGQGGVFVGAAFTKVTIGANVKKVGRRSFMGNTALREVYFLGSLDVLEYATFDGCTNLRKVELPQNLKEIEPDVFSRCKSMQQLSIPSSVEVLWESVAVECGGELIIDCDIIAPNDLPNVDNSKYGDAAMGYRDGASAFANANFTKVTFSDNVKYVGKRAFDSNRQLTSVSFGSGIKVIGEEAFRCCTKIGGELALNNVETIKFKAFNECNSLKKVTLQNIQTVEDNAFDNCPGITEVVIDNVGNMGTDVFYICSALKKATLKNIDTADGLFTSCRQLEQLNIESVATIGSFSSLTNLRSVKINNTDLIKGYAFYDCAVLERVEWSNVKMTEERIFYGSGLKSLSIGSSVNWGENAFAGSKNLETVEIFGEKKHIPAYSFTGCSSLKRLTMQMSEPPTLGKSCLELEYLHPDFQLKVPNKQKFANFWIVNGHLDGFGIKIVDMGGDDDGEDDDNSATIESIELLFVVEEFTNEL